jgi:hypothetical protein
MSASGQSRLNQPVPPSVRCLLCTGSDRACAAPLYDAKGQKATCDDSLDDLVGADE